MALGRTAPLPSSSRHLSRILGSLSKTSSSSSPQPQLLVLPMMACWACLPSCRHHRPRPPWSRYRLLAIGHSIRALVVSMVHFSIILQSGDKSN